MSRGGRRPGAGRKKKSPFATVLHHPFVPVTAPPTTNPISPIEEFDAPDDLTAEERSVWLKQAPHAFRQRTLTRSTALAFERYCKVVVFERNEAQSSARGGPNHRGLLKQINAYELQFLLSPNGRPVLEPATSPSVAEPATVGGLARFRS